jgi:hypothetical protein
VSREGRPILNYATPSINGAADFLSKMRSWRTVTVLSLLISIPIEAVFPAAGGAVLLAAVISGVMTLLYMTRAAARTFGQAYAISRLFLALSLMPILLIGPLLIPSLVETDIDRRQESRRP